MANTLQDTVNYIQPFCRYMKANIGASNQPILGIADLVRNIILSAPMTWAFNRNSDDSITTAVGTQDYASSITDFGYLERASLRDPDESKIYEIKDIMNNVSLAKATVQARPNAIAVEDFQTATSPSDAIKDSFTFANFTDQSSFQFTLPQAVAVGDVVSFAVELSNAANAPSLDKFTSGGAPGSPTTFSLPTLTPATTNEWAFFSMQPGPTTITGAGSLFGAPASDYAQISSSPVAISGTLVGVPWVGALALFRTTNGLAPTIINGNDVSQATPGLHVLSQDVTLSTPITGGSTVLVRIKTQTPYDQTVPTITDTAGNVYHLITSNFVFDTGTQLNDFGVQLYVAQNVIGGVTVVTAHIANTNGFASAGGTIRVIELSALGSPTITENLGNIISVVSDQIGGGGDTTHELTVYNMPITVPGTSTISMTFAGNRNVLVQGAQLTGTGSILVTSPVNKTGTGTTWTSRSLTPTQSTLLLTYNTSYAPPGIITGGGFSLLESGHIPDSVPTDVQLDLASAVASTGAQAVSYSQASSAEWQSVLVGYPITGGGTTSAPVFRFSAVPNKIYPVNLIYQKSPVQFATLADAWDPIPDSLSDVYNNLCLGYYMDSCQDPRAPQYIGRGIAGLLARQQGLSQMDKAIFAASYMNQSAAELLNTLRTQQGQQAQGSR